MRGSAGRAESRGTRGWLHANERAVCSQPLWEEGAGKERGGSLGGDVHGVGKVGVWRSWVHQLLLCGCWKGGRQWTLEQQR